MDKLTKQFFGDAKRMKLSSTERTQLWQGISTFASAKQISLHSREKAEGFDVIARHIHKHPIASQQHPAVFDWFVFHKVVASTMIAVLIVGVGGAGVAYASQAAVPGDTLYTVKVDITEPLIDRALTFDPERRAEWERRRLKRRLKEVENLSSHNAFTPDQRVVLQKRIEHRMAKIQERLDHVSEDHRALMQDRIDDVIEKHQNFLIDIEHETMSAQEVRAFKEHVGSMRNRAHQQWGRKPEERSPGSPPVPKRVLVPEHVRERREERGILIDGIPPKRHENIIPLRDRKPPQYDRNIGRPEGKLPLNHPLRKGIEDQKSRGFPPRPLQHGGRP